MSAAKEYISKNWLNWVAMFLISIIGIFTTFNLELFGNLATKEYVTKEVEVKTAPLRQDINSIRREQEINNKAIYMILQRIDKRTERLEDRLNSKFDK